MTDANGLQATIRHRVHAGLTLDVDLRLGAELGVLFGPSGAGKTSLARLIAGLLVPDDGLIRVGEAVLFDSTRRINLPLRTRRVGYVFQHNVLFPHLDVAANLRYGLHGWPSTEARARMDEVATLCGIDHLRQRAVGTLSGGERQRVGLARAIAPRPRILICDEPVSALDLDARYRLLHRLRQIQRAESIPVLLITHAVDEALTFGDRLWLLDHGQIQASGAPHDVLGELSERHWLAASHLQNVCTGVVTGHDPATQATTILLDGGPPLILSALDQPVGSPVVVRIDAEEIVLALGPVGPLSARNQLAATIDRIIVHDTAAEVIVRVGDLRWVVGIIAATVRSLDLKVGDPVTLILKARSCRLLTDRG